MWRSDHERYRDRTFEIREDAVLFGTGEFKAAAFHSIVGVEPIARNDEPGVKSWRVIYRDADDGTDSMELVFREHPAPRLRFASREDWWRRAPQGGKDE